MQQFTALMIRHLTSLPIWVNACLLVGAAVAFSLLASGLVHRRYKAEELERNNAVATTQFGAIGAVYGLLVALALVAVWGSYQRAGMAAAEERACIRGLRRTAWGLSKSGTARVEKALHEYMVAADEEWGSSYPNPSVVTALDGLGRALAEDRGPTSGPFVSDALGRLGRLTDLRLARLYSSEHGMPDFLWGVILFGAVVTIAFTLFFGSANRRSQRVMNAILAGTLTLVIFAVLEFDHPYTGPISIKSPFGEDLRPADTP